MCPLSSLHTSASPIEQRHARSLLGKITVRHACLRMRHPDAFDAG
jgi:hypothetical protein